MNQKEKVSYALPHAETPNTKIKNVLHSVILLFSAHPYHGICTSAPFLQGSGTIMEEATEGMYKQ